MECKNCQHELENESQFCDNCGAKVIKSRITFKFLISELFINIFGVDSKFFLTLKKLLTYPDEVLNEYLIGIRKRYVNPFAFFAIAAGLSLLVYNFFADDYIAIQTSANQEQIAEFKKMAEIDLFKIKDISKEEMIKLKARKQAAKYQISFLNNVHEFTLNYFNLLMFLFLPFYALLSKWTYRKPHNFGEHVIMNAYLCGFATYFSLIAFFLSILVHPSIYMTSMLLYFIYYLYAFGKLYKLSLGKSILKLLRFLLGLIIFILVIFILSGIVAYLIGRYIGKNNPELLNS